jgi:DNA polymerase I-like protein with 3'-5' exonuclease and polymerase domains
MFVSNDANRLVLGVPMHEGEPDEQALREAALRTLVPGLEIVGLVHDEILATVPEKHAEDAARLIDEVMRKTGGAVVNMGVPEGREVPVEAETKACNTWAEKE